MSALPSGTSEVRRPLWLKPVSIPRLTTRGLMLVVALSGIFLSIVAECAKLIRISKGRSHKAEQSASYEEGYRTNALVYVAEAQRLAYEALRAREDERLSNRLGEGAPTKPRRGYNFIPIDHLNRKAPDLEQASSSYQAAAAKAIEIANYYATLKHKYTVSSGVPWRPDAPDPPPP
ncbi:hypothetical protein ACYOEI_09880 [Singulisphaera rosea]